MKNYENILLYGILVLIILALTYSAYNFYDTRYGGSYQKAISSENSNDICATPSGYTDEQWKEHMSHHPDRYKQCL